MSKGKSFVTDCLTSFLRPTINSLACDDVLIFSGLKLFIIVSVFSIAFLYAVEASNLPNPEFNISYIIVKCSLKRLPTMEPFFFTITFSGISVCFLNFSKPYTKRSSEYPSPSNVALNKPSHVPPFLRYSKMVFPSGSLSNLPVVTYSSSSLLIFFIRSSIGCTKLKFFSNQLLKPFFDNVSNSLPVILLVNDLNFFSTSSLTVLGSTIFLAFLDISAALALSQFKSCFVISPFLAKSSNDFSPPKTNSSTYFASFCHNGFGIAASINIFDVDAFFKPIIFLIVSISKIKSFIYNKYNI